MSSESHDGGAASAHVSVMRAASARTATRHLPSAGGPRLDALEAELARALRERDAAQAERDMARAAQYAARVERDEVTAKNVAAAEQIATLQVLTTTCSSDIYSRDHAKLGPMPLLWLCERMPFYETDERRSMCC